jgi:lambda family portal protein
MPVKKHKPGQALILVGELSYPNVRKRYFGGGSGNRLIPAATQTSRRKQVPLLDFDVHRNVTNYGRRTMQTLGRHLFCASSVVRGTINDMAMHAGGRLTCEYRGETPEFKKAVERWVYQNDRICDIAGWPYSARLWRKNLVRAALMDGDMGTLLCKDENGQARIQCIPGHRIGSNPGKELVEGGPFDGAAIIEGVIIGDQLQPLGYRVLTGDSPNDYQSFVDVPADRMMLNFVPLFVGQLRGFSLVGFDAWTHQDVNESDIFELLAQKAGAGRVFQEWNETGEPAAGSDFAVGPGAGVSGAQTPSGLWREVIDEGINTYFKSSDPNQKLEAVKFDRPSANQREFKEGKLRETFYSAGWSLDFGLNPTKIGGAPLRVLVDRINARIEDLQCELIEPAARRFDAFRIPVAMLETKELPFVPDWWMLEYQPGARLTGDRKYDSDVRIQEIKFNLRSRASGCMENGEGDDDVLESNAKSVDRLFGKAQELATKYKIPFAMALERLEQATPNGNVAAAEENNAKTQSREGVEE